jgi:hypothetical protein
MRSSIVNSCEATFGEGLQNSTLMLWSIALLIPFILTQIAATDDGFCPIEMDTP